ncbi:MAG TPA: hypothetical protein VFW28_17495 [Micropepsaceae bacterium]|nr:hypothetical protein [Micropepsaceae bacterium]
MENWLLNRIAALCASCGLFAVFCCNWAQARELDLSDPFRDYIESSQKEGVPGFISECQIDENDKAMLFFRVGEQVGRYGYVQELKTGRHLTIELGAIYASGGSLRFSSTGGLTSGPAQRSLMNVLLHQPFVFVEAPELIKAFEAKSEMKCPL